MSNAPSLFHASCPSCGAEVAVHSATAVTEVCAHCHTMLVLEGERLTDSGRHSALLRDFSPLCIGASGTWQGQLFTLIGRLQVQYEGGCWNEWHALLHDGSSAWLSEAGDRYVFTRAETTPQIGTLPEFDDIRIGRTFFNYGPHHYTVADIRHIKRGRFAAEGELPYRIPEYETARAVDCRSGASFLTLDYGESEQRPEVFIGEGVTLAALALQNVRRFEQIRSSAGHKKGSRENSTCPQCGAPVHWVTGVATHVVCEYCQSRIDFDDDTAHLVQAGDMRAAQQQALTLKLGSRGRIMGDDWWVIGAMKQSEVSADDAWLSVCSYTEAKVLVPDGEPWFEYLLYAPEQGFLWLTEMADKRWAVSKTLDVWPLLQQPLRPIDGQKRAVPKLYDYGGQVQYAAGAFYWQVAPKDTTYYVDFGREKQKLSTALMREEQSWSASSDIDAAAVAAWFKDSKIGAKPLSLAAADGQIRQALRMEAQHFSGTASSRLSSFADAKAGRNTPLLWLLIYAVLNFPAMLMGLARDGFTGIIVVSMIVYWLLNLPFKSSDE